MGRRDKQQQKGQATTERRRPTGTHLTALFLLFRPTNQQRRRRRVSTQCMHVLCFIVLSFGMGSALDPDGIRSNQASSRCVSQPDSSVCLSVCLCLYPCLPVRPPVFLSLSLWLCLSLSYAVCSFFTMPLTTLALFKYCMSSRRRSRCCCCGPRCLGKSRCRGPPSGWEPQFPSADDCHHTPVARWSSTALPTPGVTGLSTVSPS